MTEPTTSRCPCGTGATYDACCAPLHSGATPAPTAERLMRARYSAYALHLGDYLLDTWHPSTRPAELGFDASLRWTGLEILDVFGGGLLADEGSVEFVARYERGQQQGSLHELSRFVRHHGDWLYLEAAEAELT